MSCCGVMSDARHSACPWPRSVRTGRSSTTATSVVASSVKRRPSGPSRRTASRTQVPSVPTFSAAVKMVSPRRNNRSRRSPAYTISALDAVLFMRLDSRYPRVSWAYSALTGIRRLCATPLSSADSRCGSRAAAHRTHATATHRTHPLRLNPSRLSSGFPALRGRR